MTIPNELLEKWTMYRSHGDVTSIAEKAGVTTATVSNAFRNGRCNDELFVIMADYFEEKEERFSSYLSDYQE